MYRISKQFLFSASHSLDFLDKEHSCGRIHGHNYLLIIHLKSEILTKCGFVIDYKDLNKIKYYVEKVLDHQHLNDIFPFNPTSENMARFVYEKFKPIFPQLCAVEIKETAKTSCIYEK